MKTMKLSKSLIGIIVVTCVLLMVVLHLQVSDSHHSEQSANTQNKLRFSTLVESTNKNNENSPLAYQNQASTPPPSISLMLERERGSSEGTVALFTPTSSISENDRRISTVDEEATTTTTTTTTTTNKLSPAIYEGQNHDISNVVDKAESDSVTREQAAVKQNSFNTDEFHKPDSLTEKANEVVASEQSGNDKESSQSFELITSASNTAVMEPLISANHDVSGVSSASLTNIEEIPQQLVEITRETIKSGIVTVDETVFSELIQLYEDKFVMSDILNLHSDPSEIKEMDISSLDVVYSFHNALKKGQYCSSRRPKPVSSTAYSYGRSTSEDGIVTAIKSAAKSQGIEFLIEYVSQQSSTSSKSLVNKVSKHLPHMPIVSMIYNQITGFETSSSSSSSTSSSDESCNDPIRNTYSSTQRNIFKSFDSLTPFVTNDGGRRNCIQVLESPSFYVHDLLPFEFEQVFSGILCQCKYSILPSRLPDLPYFANWDTIQSLIDAASTGSNQRCDLTLHDGSGDFQTIRYDNVIVSQNISFPNASSYKSHQQDQLVNSGKLFVSDFDQVVLDSRSKLNIALEVATYFEMFHSNSSGLGSEISTVDGSSSPLLPLKGLAWNGSFLINMSDPVDFSLSSYKKYQSFSSSANSEKITRVTQPQSSTESIATDTTQVQQSSAASITTVPGTATENVGTIVSNTNKTDSSSSTLVLQFPSDLNILSNSSSGSSSALLADNHTTRSNAISIRRRLYGMSTSGSTGTDNNDVLGSTTVNFAWILPNEDNQKEDHGEEIDLDGKLITGIKDAMHFLSTDPSQQSLIESMTKDNSKYYITKDSRKLHSLLYREENFAYHQWMHYLQLNQQDSAVLGKKRVTILDDFTAPSTKLIYLYGQRLSLLSVKLSKLISGRRRSFSIVGNEAMIVTMASDWKSAMTQYRLTKLMNIGNNVITVPQWSLGMITALLGSPERADVALFESDILLKVVAMVYDLLLEKANLEGAEEETTICQETALIKQFFSILLSTSRVSYVKFSSPHVTHILLEMVAPQCAHEWFSLFKDPLSFLEEVSYELKFHANITVQELHSPCSWSKTCHQKTKSLKGTKRLSIEDDIMLYRFSMKKVVDESISGNPILGHHRYNSKAEEVYQKFWQKSSKQGFSIYSAIWFGLLTEQKKRLLELIVNLPLWKAQGSTFEEKLASLAAWNVYLQVSSGSTSKTAASSASSFSRKSGKLSDPNKEEPQFWRIMLHELENDQSSGPSLNAIKAVFPLGVTTSSKLLDLSNEIALGKSLWSLLQTEFAQHSAELAAGKFSFVEHDSGNGYISSRLSLDYPQATVISIERDEYYTSLHNRVVEMLNISNNAVCLKKGMDDESIYRNIYECPELFRFQLLFRNVLQGFKEASTLDSWGETMGMALSTALTSFIYVPNRSLVSWGLYLLYGPIYLYGTSTKEGTGKDAVHFIRSPGSYRPLFDAVGSTSENNGRNRDSFGSSFAHAKFQMELRHQALLEHYRELSSLGSHPQRPFNNFPSDWLLSTARAKDGSTSLLISPMSANTDSDSSGSETSGHSDGSAPIRYRGQLISIHRPFLEFPLVRCDIVNMTRHVHHHFDYKKDGHSRTYTMHVDVNQTLTHEIQQSLGHDISRAISAVDEHGVHLRSKNNYYQTTTLPLGYHPSQHNAVSVRLYRDKDNWPIPYVSIYGITLISALRLGLNDKQRNRFFHSFLQLPLYEDMAPWNIVLMGPKLDYIDYDTREFTFNADIPKAYKVMSVLMNYKRTVEDFKKCGSKAGTVYGLPYVSDCVGNSELNLKCDDLAYPVPCSDGKCHTDYISCLRSLADIAQEITDRQLHQRLSRNNNEEYFEHISQNLASAMNAVVAKFNETSYAKLTYEEFLDHQLK